MLCKLMNNDIYYGNTIDLSPIDLTVTNNHDFLLKINFVKHGKYSMPVKYPVIYSTCRTPILYSIYVEPKSKQQLEKELFDNCCAFVEVEGGYTYPLPNPPLGI